MLNHPAAKFVVAVVAVVAVAIQSYLNGPGDTISWSEWLQVIVAGLGAATVWFAGNVYSHPLYTATKAIVFGLSGAAAWLVAYVDGGGDLDAVNWWNVVLIGVGAVLVYAAPKSPDNEPVGVPQ